MTTMIPMTPEICKDELDKGQLTVIDVRSNDNFIIEHIENSIFGLLQKNDPNHSKLKLLSGVVKKNSPIMIVSNQGDEEITYTTQAGIGFTHIKGYQEGGFAAWKTKGYPTNKINKVDSKNFFSGPKLPENIVLDVRNSSEWKDKGVRFEAMLVPLSDIMRLKDMGSSKIYYIHCASGGRALMAVSYLISVGYKNLNVILGEIDFDVKEVDDKEVEQRLAALMDEN